MPALSKMICWRSASTQEASHDDLAVRELYSALSASTGSVIAARRAGR